MTMKQKRSRQKPHKRRSKKGKIFRAGKGKKKRKKRRSYSSLKYKMPKEEVESFTKMLKRDSVIIPNIGKFKIKKIKAKPRRKGINPFTKQEQWFKAKPASKKVKFYASKSLKELIKSLKLSISSSKISARFLYPSEA